MPFSLLPALLLQVIVVGYTPGPANIYAMSMAIRHGRKTALRAWTGMAVGFTAAACLLAVLTAVIGEVLGDYIAWLRYMGAAYLLWLAWKMLRSGLEPEDAGKSCNFISGFTVQATNAKMLLYDLSVFSTFVLPYSRELKDLLAVIPVIFIGGPVSNLLWLMTGHWMRGAFSKNAKAIDLVCSLALAGCAVYVAIS